MKRITYWPQAWLGIAMNFGLVVSWVAITNEFNIQLLTLLMVGSWGWTMHYGLFSNIFQYWEPKADLSIRYHLRLPGSQGRRKGWREVDGCDAR
jgi:hypothetical protein